MVGAPSLPSGSRHISMEGGAKEEVMVVNDGKEEKPPPPPYGTTPGEYANDDTEVGPVDAGLGPAAPAPGLSELRLGLGLGLSESVGVCDNCPGVPGGEVGVEVALASFDGSGLSSVFVFVSAAAVGVPLPLTPGLEPEPPGKLCWPLLPGGVLGGWLLVEPPLLIPLLGVVTSGPGGVCWPGATPPAPFGVDGDVELGAGEREGGTVAVVNGGSFEPRDGDGGAVVEPLLPFSVERGPLGPLPLPLLPTLDVNDVSPIVGADPGVGVVDGLAIPPLGLWLALLLGAAQFVSVEPGVHVLLLPEGAFSRLVGLVGLVGPVALAGPVGLVRLPGLAGTVELVGPLGWFWSGATPPPLSGAVQEGSVESAAQVLGTGPGVDVEGSR